MKPLFIWMRFSAVLSATLLPGCLGNGRVDAGFIAYWSFADENETPLTCEMLKADRVVLEIVDTRGVSHSYEAPCDILPFATKEWEIAAGIGEVNASLQNRSGAVIAAVDSFSFQFAAGRSANVLPEITFVVPDDQLAVLGPHVDISLQLTAGNGLSVSCDTIGTGFLSFTLRDSSGTLIELGAAPCDTFVDFAADMPTVPAPGNAALEIAFRNPSFVRVDTQTFDVQLALGDVGFGPLMVPVHPHVTEGDAGITWQWTAAAAPLDEAACADADIDYGALYIRDDVTETWWTDPARLTAPCAAFDHADDDAVFGRDVYSGIFLNPFLPQGAYTLFLGLFRNAASDRALGADVLAAFDTAMPDNVDGPDGTLLADTASGTNLLLSNLSEFSLPSGDLRILLGWENGAGFDSCAVSGVSEMGVYLQSAFGPATSLRLSDAYACEDTLLFDRLPKTTEPYTLAVYGLDGEGRMRWYQSCEDLFPEALPNAAQPPGYRCDVSLLTVPSQAEGDI